MPLPYLTSQAIAMRAKRVEPVNFTNPALALEPTEPTGQGEAEIRLGNWTLQAAIGEGSWTRVYRAAADGGPGRYAIKVLRSQWNGAEEAVPRMRREAQVGRSISHPHVISVLQSHVHQAPYYLVMPRLEGSSVAQTLRRQSLSLAIAIWIARQAAEGLAALHAFGYLHGDIKPENLFLSPSGHVTLIDLGSSIRLDEQSTFDRDSIAGTLAYLAPELLAGGAADARSDLYSLGITLFEIVAGRLPWDTTNRAELAKLKCGGNLPDVREFSPQTPIELAQLIRRLSACEPLRRHASARELIEALVHFEVLALRQRLSA